MKKKEANNLIDSYFEIKANIHEYFKYVPDWVEIPMRDERSSHWMIVGSETDGKVVWSDCPLTVESIADGNIIFSGRIYTQRFLKKWVYRTPSHVMISVDTRTDGNKFLMIFSRANEQSDEKLIQEYNNHW